MPLGGALLPVIAHTLLEPIKLRLPLVLHLLRADCPLRSFLCGRQAEFCPKLDGAAPTLWQSPLHQPADGRVVVIRSRYSRAGDGEGVDNLDNTRYLSNPTFS